MLRRILEGRRLRGALFDWHFVEVRHMTLKNYLRCRAAWSRKKTQAKTQHKRRVRQGSRPKEQRGRG